MPHLTLQLSPQGLGPLVDVQIGPSSARRQALSKANLPVPPFTPTRALIDTGASISAVDPGVLMKLGLTPSGSTNVHTPSTGVTPHQCPTYDVTIQLPHPAITRWWDPVAVIGVALAHQGFDMLLGRDVLKDCLLVYDGAGGSFQIAF